MKKLKTKILIGIPASGKSTWSLNFTRINSDWVRVSRDDFRFMLKDQPMCEPKIESLINTLQDSVIIESLKKGLNVIIDNTNLKESYIEHFCNLVQPYASVEFQIFDISLKKALERDAVREKKVGKDVIERMFKQYEILVDSFDPSVRGIKRKDYKNPILDPAKENVILCDLDGTVAHMNSKRGPFDWDKVDRDDVDMIVADRLRNHAKLGEKVIIVTGRDESCRELTEDWLDFYDIPYSEMFMRKADDYRKDSIIKKEIYDNDIFPRYNVLFVYDDRNQVVEMWRGLGVKVFQVELGRF
jgi:predicted kinase